MSTTYTITNEGLRIKLSNVQNNIYGGGRWELSTDTFGDLTTVNAAAIHQPSFPGYAAQFNPTATISSGTTTIASLSFTQVTFTCTGTVAPQTVTSVVLFGYDNVSAVVEVLAIANLPGGPQVISQPGDSIVAQCTITDQRA